MPDLATGDERAYVLALIERIIQECPRRKATSDDELRSSMMIKQELENLGLKVQVEEFCFNDNLYANMALHFGIGSAGTVISPVLPQLALVLHLLAGTSYWADSTRRGYILRKLFRFRPSQNVIAVLLAEGEPALRIVINAHVDAAFTGLVFNPALVRKLGGSGIPEQLAFVKRSMALATRAQFILAGFDLLRCCLGPLTLPLRPIEHLLNIPGLLSFIFGLEATLRDEIVPGANDDLSGVAALPVLAARLAPTKRPDVELVFVATGSEEASLGGGDALARSKRDEWDRQRTVFLALDSLTNGQLHFLEMEGEVVTTPTPRWLVDVINEAVASEPRFASIRGYQPPVGGSDAAAFLAHGYDAVCLTCVDPELGSPHHYHLPSDTPENLDMDQLMQSIDFAERVVNGIVRSRLGSQTL